MFKQISLLVFLTLISCSKNYPAGDYSAQEKPTICNSELKRVSEIRKLAWLEPVKCLQLRAEDFARRLRKSIAERNTQERLEREAEIYRFLGAIPLGFNYPGDYLKSIEASALGFYDSRSKDLVVKNLIDQDSSSPSLAADQVAVVRHELTHGLQDQHFVVDNIISDKISIDMQLAREALLEGDAMWTMVRAEGKDPCPVGLIGQQILWLNDTLTEQDSIPPTLKILSQFPYAFGLVYVCNLRSQGGVELLNRKFREPPTKSQEIIAKGMPQKSISEPNPASLGAGFVTSLLGPTQGISQALVLARKLTDDRIFLEPKKALTWTLEWQTEDAARRALNAFVKYFENNRNAACTVTSEGTTLVCRCSQP
ncbi:hypothetical protein JNK13_00460 [bacterium]|nr:hypothetical protein [bacterium]